MLCVILLAVLAPATIAGGRGQGDMVPLRDEMRPVTAISRSSFTVQYFTPEPDETRIQVREGGLPNTAWRRAGRLDLWSSPGVRTIEGPPGKRRWHEVTVTGLKPSTQYWYRVYDTGSVPTSQEANWGAKPPWRREFAVSTQAREGYKTVMRVPIKVLLMTNVIRVESAHENGVPIAPEPAAFTPEQLAKVKEEFHKVAVFFWVNSGMRYWADFHFVVDDRWQRWGPEVEQVEPFYRGWPASRAWAGQDFPHAGGGAFTIVDMQNPLRHNTEPIEEEQPFGKQIEIAFPRRWDRTRGEWVYYNSGGGALGVDSFPNGIPGRCQYLGGGDIAWLTCHEFHHLMESASAFSLSNREDERVVFNHYAPRERVKNPDGTYREMVWNTSGPHGEHWDGMAYWDRTMSDAQWLREYFGQPVAVRDADMDGFPDNDARLPLDERRFGSSARRAQTDGQMNDLDKAMLSTWTPEILQSTWTKPEAYSRIRPNPRSADSDQDGLDDGKDPLPLWPFLPYVFPLTATVDGRDQEWEGTPFAAKWELGTLSMDYRHGHSERAFFGVIRFSRDVTRVNITLDGEGEGVYSTQAIYGMEFRRDGEGIAMRETFPSPGVDWKATVGGDGSVVVEFSIPNRGDGKWFWHRGGRPILWTIAVGDARSWHAMYEPYRLIRSIMLEPTGSLPLPPNAPPELSAADSVTLRPGSTGLSLGAGWQLREGHWAHPAVAESPMLIPVPETGNFDLWIEFEARQDMILGGFQAATAEPGAGRDYIVFLGGYANTVTRFRLFGREEGDTTAMVDPGVRTTLQLTRRDGELWVLKNGRPILYAVDPMPTLKVNRLGVMGGYGGDQRVFEIRYRVQP